MNSFQSQSLDGLYGTQSSRGLNPASSTATANTPSRSGATTKTLAQQVRHELRTDLRKLRELEDRLEDHLAEYSLDQHTDEVEQRLNALQQQLIETCSQGAFKQFQTLSTGADEQLHQRINGLAATTETQHQALTQRLDAHIQQQEADNNAQRLETLIAETSEQQQALTLRLDAHIQQQEADNSAQRLNTLITETGVQQQRVAKNIADINSKIAALTDQIAGITACTCATQPHRCQQTLGYIDFIGDAASDNMKALVQQHYTVQALSPNSAETATALTKRSLHTLIYPEDCGGSLNLNANSLYNEFVTQGGRIIFCMHQTNIDSCINSSFHWALQHTSHHNSQTKLTGTDLNTAAPRMIQHTGCVNRSSLPAGAKVFLNHGDDIAGFYLRHGKGEIIGIGYDWESGSDGAWDALLTGLISGTALNYQRLYWLL